MNRIRREAVTTSQSEADILGSGNVPSHHIDAFRMARLFSTLTEEEYSQLMNGVSFRVVPPGQTLSWQGSAVEFVHFILKGKAKAEVCAQAKSGYVAVIGLLGPGDSVGLLSIVDGAPHSATVVAIEQIEAIAVPLGAFQAMLLSHREWHEILAEEAISRLRNSDQWLQTLL